MTPGSSEILTTVAQELNVSEDDLLRQGLHQFLERRLRTIKAEIFAIYGRYGIRSIEEMESRYRDGTIEEACSWHDFQRLDHLEYKRDRLFKLLDALS